MKVAIYIPKSLKIKLENRMVVEALDFRSNKAIMSNSFLEAYEVLSEMSQLKSFFFSIYLPDQLDEKMKVQILEICKNSSENNSELVVLNLPDTLDTFAISFYEFSDILYYLNEEPNHETVKVISDYWRHNKPTINNKDIYQVIFPYINGKWLIENEKLKPHFT